MTGVTLFLEWLLLEADHRRAILDEDWNVLHVEETGWRIRAGAAGWR